MSDEEITKQDEVTRAINALVETTESQDVTERHE